VITTFDITKKCQGYTNTHAV